MIWTPFTCCLDTRCSFPIDFSASGYLTWPVGLHFGPTKRLKSIRDIKSTRKVDQNHLKYILWTLSRRFLPNIPILAIFGPEMKVHMYCEVLGCAEISRNATRDIESTIIVDQNHLNYKLWRLSRRYWPNVLILATFGFAMKAHRSSEAPRCTEISRKATKDIRIYESPVK